MFNYFTASVEEHQTSNKSFIFNLKDGNLNAGRIL